MEEGRWERKVEGGGKRGKRRWEREEGGEKRGREENEGRRENKGRKRGKGGKGEGEGGAQEEWWEGVGGY